MVMAQTPVVLTPFRGAAATAVGRSATLAATASGGRRVSTQVRTRGAGTCTTITTRCTGSATTRRTASLSVASRIERCIAFFDNLTIWQFAPDWCAFVMRDNYTRLRCNEDENIDQV